MEEAVLSEFFLHVFSTVSTPQSLPQRLRARLLLCRGEVAGRLRLHLLPFLLQSVTCGRVFACWVFTTYTVKGSQTFSVSACFLSRLLLLLQSSAHSFVIRPLSFTHSLTELFRASILVVQISPDYQTKHIHLSLVIHSIASCLLCPCIALPCLSFPMSEHCGFSPSPLAVAWKVGLGFSFFFISFYIGREERRRRLNVRRLFAAFFAFVLPLGLRDACTFLFPASRRVGGWWRYV